MSYALARSVKQAVHLSEAVTRKDAEWKGALDALEIEDEQE